MMVIDLINKLKSFPEHANVIFSSCGETWGEYCHIDDFIDPTTDVVSNDEIVFTID